MLRDTKYLSVRTRGDDEVMCHVSGENVLVHCLAGAHRAGTAGVIAVMYLTGLRHVQVTLDTDTETRAGYRYQFTLSAF